MTVYEQKKLLASEKRMRVGKMASGGLTMGMNHLFDNE